MNRLFPTRTAPSDRKGAILVLSALLMIVILGLAAFAIDIGYMMLVRTQLQLAADAGAMAAGNSMNLSPSAIEKKAQEYVGYHAAGTKKLDPKEIVVEMGTWDATTNKFSATKDLSNAVRVTARREGSNFFFARVLGQKTFDMEASSIAMANPRDIAFVIDLSGSMNDDGEPAWATNAITDVFGALGFPSAGNDLMKDIFSDFGYGSFPGTLQWVGNPLKIAANNKAYTELTKDSGVLTTSSIATKYRIATKDTEATRKQKAYSWIIDNQIATVMPKAKPVPDSSKNYAYWEKYLDYIIEPINDSKRKALPPSQASDRIDGFNNPNTSTFPKASASVPRGFRNQIGYRTYVQFMMDHGRDLKPDGKTFVPLSYSSPDCPMHSESTAGGTFSFPPREQPTHAARRSMIAAMSVVEERNKTIPSMGNRDHVSVVTYDRLNSDSPKIVQTLTGDYRKAMEVCTTLQAVGDIGSSTATEAGLQLAMQHLKPKAEGGVGRKGSQKVIVLLTDGVPNLYQSSTTTINNFLKTNKDSEFYTSSNYAYNAPLMVAKQMSQSHNYLFPVGIGLGTDYDFMDRLSRLGGTANSKGQSARGSGNPTQYEKQLTDIFEKIIKSPTARLVQ